MTLPRSYCDWNATAPILPDAAEAVSRALALCNPSSIHGEGRKARAAVEQARTEVAALFGVGPASITFTSGGTEAAATALQPAAADDVLLIGAAEHPCVLAGGSYGRDNVVIVPVDAEGRATVEAFAAAVADRRAEDHRVHIALQIANNETGVINPPEIFAAARAQGWHVTADAVQAAGRIDLAPYIPHVSNMFISAHKLGGPKGVGAIVTPDSACGATRALLAGGGQEHGLRGGTENVAGIVGFGMAARHARMGLDSVSRQRDLRDGLERRLLELAPDATIFARMADRLPNTCLFAVPGMQAATALIAFDLDGVAVSSGSACSSGKVGRSHVLAAMGVDPALAAAAIRVSFGDRSTEQDVDQVLKSLDRQLARLQSRRPAA